MVCTAPAASGHFYQLTERNSEMRETSLASFHIETFCKKYHEHIRAMIVAMAKMKVSFVRILHLLQEPDHQHMCRERIHVRVWKQLYSHHVVIRRKMELQEFWIRNQLLSTSTSYSSSIQFTCSDRTCIQKIFVCDGRCHCSMGEDEASFCPTALSPIEAPLCNLDPRKQYMSTSPLLKNFSFASRKKEIFLNPFWASAASHSFLLEVAPWNFRRDRFLITSIFCAFNVVRLLVWALVVAGGYHKWSTCPYIHFSRKKPKRPTFYPVLIIWDFFSKNSAFSWSPICSGIAICKRSNTYEVQFIPIGSFMKGMFDKTASFIGSVKISWFRSRIISQLRLMQFICLCAWDNHPYFNKHSRSKALHNWKKGISKSSIKLRRK